MSTDTEHSLSLSDLRCLIAWLRQRFGHDFSNYAPASFMRRVQHALRRSGYESVLELKNAVEKGTIGLDELLQLLTVSVSEMFRDPEYFFSLRENVIPHLHTYPSIRVWIAGCSTGEEACSMAILLHEENLLDRTILYATDINATAIEKARRGIYPLEQLQNYTRNYQRAGGKRAFSDYYTAAYGSVRFDPALQRRITFAEHSLATDASFAEMNLISCRNVLIYFNRSLQARAFGVFQESLCRQGFLGLGMRETVEFSPAGEHFDTFDHANRIYRTKLNVREQPGITHVGRIKATSQWERRTT
jgi:chemotaxis protein methyltransferase CheR